MSPLKKIKASLLLKRRKFIKIGTLSAAAAVAGQGFMPHSKVKNEKTNTDYFHTPLCDILGIKFPIIQSGMGSVATPELAAKVSEAGGLGIIGATFLTPDELRDRIHRVRQLPRNLLVSIFYFMKGLFLPWKSIKFLMLRCRRFNKCLTASDLN